MAVVADHSIGCQSVKKKTRNAPRPPRVGSHSYWRALHRITDGEKPTPRRAVAALTLRAWSPPRTAGRTCESPTNLRRLRPSPLAREEAGRLLRPGVLTKAHRTIIDLDADDYNPALGPFHKLS